MACHCADPDPLCEMKEESKVERTFLEGESPPYLPTEMDKKSSVKIDDVKMGPIGPWATGRVEWGPNSGLTGVRPVVDRYSITRFSPKEWRQFNKDVFDSVINTDSLIHNTKCQIQMVTTSTDKEQNDNSVRLLNRAREIRRYQQEIEGLVQMLREEIVLLTKSKIKVKFALPALLLPESIAGECIERRTCRIEPELVRDEVEEELVKEIAMVRETRDLFARILQQIEIQILANKSCKDQLETDWSDKKQSSEMEEKNAALRNNAPSILFHAGAARFQGDQSSPQHWEHFTQEIIKLGKEEIQKSRDLRKTVESTLLADSIRDLGKQADKVLNALKKRIEETDQCRQAFERDLENLLKQIAEAESLYEGLIKLLRQLDFTLKVAQTRLDNRMGRLRAENCRDESQYGLIDEVNNINDAISKIKAQIADVDATLSRLYKTRASVEYAIMAKRKTLYIDQQRCMDYRSRYPDAVTLSGGL